mmetsp:Transcript_25643/g.36167  ORF Transcript_25643/g.36167 Transcript_25643/m.36167 type:complete len:478 (-) Transcript_25643:214-1647(-)
MPDHIIPDFSMSMTIDTEDGNSQVSRASSQVSQASSVAAAQFYSQQQGPPVRGIMTSSSPAYYASSGSASVASTDNYEVSLKRDREREGRCSECGAQTHELRMDPMGNTSKIPLTVENEVHRGRCLLCHPIQQRPSQQQWGRVSSSHRSVGSHRSANTVSTGHSIGTNSQLSGRSNNGGAQVAADYVDSCCASTISTIPREFSTQSSHNGADYLTTCSRSSSGGGVEETIARLSTEATDLCDVLAAMRRYPNEPRIQAKGCEKLWIQSWDDENSSAIGRVGGIPTILEAMRTFLGNVQLQQCGCEALQNLANTDYNRDVICENGGVNVICRTMDSHIDVVGVQQAGCTALANLAADTDHHLDIANAGGLHLIIKAAQRFSDEETVMRAAYQALRAMGYDPSRHGQQAQRQQQEQQQNVMQASDVAAGVVQQQHQQQIHGSGDSTMADFNNEENMIRLDQHGFPLRRRRGGGSSSSSS